MNETIKLIIGLTYIVIVIVCAINLARESGGPARVRHGRRGLRFFFRHNMYLIQVGCILKLKYSFDVHRGFAVVEGGHSWRSEDDYYWINIPGYLPIHIAKERAKKASLDFIGETE